MILGAFGCPIVKRGQLQSYLILSSKGVFKNQNVFLHYRNDSNYGRSL